MERELHKCRQRDRRKSAYNTRSLDIILTIFTIALVIALGLVCYAATTAIRNSARNQETFEDRVLAEEPLTVTKTPSGKRLSTYVITDPKTKKEWIIAPNGSLVERGEPKEESNADAEYSDAY